MTIKAATERLLKNKRHTNGPNKRQSKHVKGDTSLVNDPFFLKLCLMNARIKMF